METSAIVAWLRKVQHTLHKYAESIRKAEQGKRNQEMDRQADPLKVQAVVSLDEKTIALITPQKKSTDPTQESIKNATWAAFYAVAAYAVVTTFMWCAMLQQNKIASDSLRLSKATLDIQTRPWIGFSIASVVPPATEIPSRTIEANNLLKFTVNLRNYGHSPALHVDVRTDVITHHIPREWPAKWEACKSTAVDKNRAEVVFPSEDPIPHDTGSFIRSGSFNWIIVCVTYGEEGSSHHTAEMLSCTDETGNAVDHATKVKRLVVAQTQAD